ncbi:MAG: glycosyltransferase family 4 protein [Rhodocyclaceae bacterium]|nr:glycosyltransferase family 4 protein [Rhodocyclaceae bacterium]MCO5097918.1 glycosyltransferase family 4 protein [Rhodocyclaceae bacterium]
MRILLTSHVFLPDYASGTEILTFSTAKELQRQGHEVEVCTGYPARPGLTDAQRFDSYEYEGIRVRRFLHDAAPMGEQSNVAEAEYNNLFFARWFRGYLSQSRPDMVHFFHLGLLSASAIDACHELGIPMVMTPTDFWLICPNNQLRLPDNSLCKGPDRDGVNCMKHAVSNNQPPHVAWIFNRLPHGVVATMIRGINRGAFSGSWFAPMVRALYQRAGFLKERMNKLDRVIMPTRLMQEMLVTNGLDPDKTVPSRFGIRLAKPEERHPDVEGRLRIGFIGGLSEHKGAHLLISAFRRLPDTATARLALMIYGRTDRNPKYHERLRLLAGDDQRIRFCGTFPNEQIGEIFSELDVLVVPSIWYENTPLVIYSAQAAGCPIVASNLGGMAEVVEHGKNGLLFRAGDVPGLAGALNRLANDRPLLRQLAANAIRPKSIADYVSELRIIYDEVLRERRGKA